MSSPSFFFLFSLGLAVVGCSAQSVDATSATDSDITGVTDLTELESAFGLSKDFQTADGSWYRTDAKLKAGPCYKKTVGGADGASYQFRRYSEGAAFFKLLGAGPASGDERPVVCVDVDIDTDGDYTDDTTIEADDFQVDGAIRYRWGKPGGGDGAAGSLYETFTGGAIHFINQFCSETPFDAQTKAAFTSGCLAGATWPGSISEIDGAAMLVVYQYALKQASASNRYSSQADAVGRFISVEGDWQSPVQHIRYEKADLHIVRGGAGGTQYMLTPKNSDASLSANPLASCTISGKEGASQATCTGI